jgi:hypothetical protein
MSKPTRLTAEAYRAKYIAGASAKYIAGAAPNLNRLRRWVRMKRKEQKGGA